MVGTPVCRRGDRYEPINGFKRLGAARRLAQVDRLSARLMEADERTVKAAIYGLNRAGGRTRELEEAWIIHALVREDGISQVEVAELLGRHKSWVCRRLALIERLGAKARDDLRVGLLSPTAARQIVRLPQGNQAEVLDAMRREALSGAELTVVVDLWLGCSERNQQQYILAHPREALSQAKGAFAPGRDPRLSEAGNQVWKRVGLLLDVLGRMEVWLAHRDRAGLTAEDRAILTVYRREDLVRALERAGRYRAFSWSAVERILAAQAKPRSAMEALTIEAREQLDEMLRQIPRAPRSTAEYQTLLEDTAKDEENHESEDNGPDDPTA